MNLGRIIGRKWIPNRLSGDFGSIGRAIQVAVEILYHRARFGMPVVGSGIAAAEENRQDLKVPLAFSVLPRTERLIEWLSSDAYKDRGGVINSCEEVLSDLSIEYYIHRLTPAEQKAATRKARRQRK